MNAWNVDRFHLVDISLQYVVGHDRPCSKTAKGPGSLLSADTEQTEAARLNTDVVVYSDASGRHGHLERQL
jgi:hypothetical protein